MTWEAKVGDGFPEELAEGAAKGTSQAVINALVIG
jgi:hypothetical protein